MYNYFWIIVGVIIVASLIHMGVARKPYRKGQVLGIWTLHLLFWGAGIGGILGFLFLDIEPMESHFAHYLRWPTANPYQELLGISMLALGVLGVLCLWFRGGFWLATAIFAWVYGWGQLILLAMYGVKTDLLVLSIIYGGLGPLVTIIMLIARRACLSCCEFWRPTCCCCTKKLDKDHTCCYGKKEHTSELPRR